jgi:hypothetical protein
MFLRCIREHLGRLVLTARRQSLQSGQDPKIVDQVLPAVRVEASLITPKTKIAPMKTKWSAGGPCVSVAMAKPKRPGLCNG